MRHKSLDSLLLLFCIECVTFPAGSYGPKRQQCKKLTNKPGQVHKYFIYIYTIVCLVIERERARWRGARDTETDKEIPGWGGFIAQYCESNYSHTLFCL